MPIATDADNVWLINGLLTMRQRQSHAW
jgi:hypothetical protein